ncbi:MAG: 4Fe-4S binding protein, partial [Candidatus Thermoplasmatota archaeon]|nr:4Fe-4S binding protein [Candidatus Thermoplasmatota archaeon]MBU1940800.1 4Fe-4S binding protein [Candidatus Thermoplasmatota archaeon]
IGRGHHAAKGIHAYLRGTTVSEPEKIFKSLQIYLGSEQCSNIKFLPKSAETSDKLTFEEVQGSYSDYEAVEEASRCFSCGPCYACPTCLPNCKNKQLIATIGTQNFLVKSPQELSYDITTKGPATIKLKVDGLEKSITLHSITAKVNPDLCIGCGRCEEVCAYRAIKNIINKDTRTLAEVAHNTCASCAACVSVCPAGAITQGYMSDDAILQRLTQKSTPYDGVKALMSFWSTPSPLFGSYDGITELMSSRKPSPSFLIRALAETGRGLLIIKPDSTTGSHYLPWEEYPSDVIQQTWDLLQIVGISPQRIYYQDLPKNQHPSELLKKYAEKLDQQHLKKITIPNLQTISSPLGKTHTILKHMQSHPDTIPTDHVISLPPIQQNGIAYFEGCLPLLSQIGIAQKLFNLSSTRQAILNLLKKIYPTIGAIPALGCPSQQKDITKKNNQIIKQLQPQKIILATPEAYTSFTNQPHTTQFTALPKELHAILNTTKSLKSPIKTIALHPACSLKPDPFYQPTKELLKKIPGITIIDLPQKCGESKFEQITGQSKQIGLSLMHEAAAHNADVILCTSPYCESHLQLCQREGSWRSVDIAIGTLYTFLTTALGDEMQ